MATTSETYSKSLIPTSTLASGSSTPTGDSGDSDAISDLFSSGGSPPLVVAFFAIGLFVISMVGVFGWRRLSRSRGPGPARLVIADRRHKSTSLGKKPTLWDVCADPKVPERSLIEVTRWENITPVTANLTFQIPPTRPLVDSPPVRSEGPNGHTLFRMLRSLVVAVKRSYLPDPPPRPPPPPPLPEKETDMPPAPDEIEWGDVSSLQVTVILVMPVQRRCCSGSPDPKQMELGEFCIGTMDVPWSEGGRS